MIDVSPSESRRPAPELTGPACDAIRYGGGHLQIIASAGSGKTLGIADSFTPSDS